VTNARLARMAQQRQMYVRSGPNNLLYNDPDGWVRDQSGPVRWGDWPTANQPAWYLGDDQGGGAWAIGPNGPNLSGSSLLPGVTRCTGIISSTIVRTLWRYTAPDGTALPRPLWIDDPMGIGRMPGVVNAVLPAGLRLDGHSFFETWLTHAIWWGRGAFVFVENADGQPTPGTLRILNPFLIDTDDTGHWVIDPNGDTPIRTGFDGQFIAGGKVWRLVVMRGITPNDGSAPEGVLVRHFDTFRLGAAVSEYVATTFSGMGIPAGLLKVSTPGFTGPDADALKASWMNAHGKGRRSVAVLNATVEFQPISISPVDTDAEKMLHLTRADIAHAFGLSSIWLDEGASGLTYQNNSDRRRDLVDISLAGWSEAMMAVLTALMPYGTRVDVNWATFTQPSVETLLPPLVAGVDAGILTATEARKFLGMLRMSGPDPDFHDNSPAAKEPQPVPPALQAFAEGTDPTTEEVTQ
jgi:HK97 family phage portal protein